MEVKELKKKCINFLEQDYLNPANEKENLLHRVMSGKTHIVIDFKKLSAFDYKLAEFFLDSPSLIFESMKIAIEGILSQTGNPSYKEITLHPRFKNVPKYINKKWTLSNVDMGKMIMLTGIISSSSEKKYRVIEADFLCSNCGNKIKIYQSDHITKLKEPNKCICGRKGKFTIESEKVIDIKSMILQEAPEDAGGDLIKKCNIFLKNDMCEPQIENMLKSGSKITVVGEYIGFHKEDSKGRKNIEFETYLNLNFVQFSEEISSNEKKINIQEFKDFAVAEPLEKISKIAYKDVFGFDEYKKLILLSIVGAVTNENKKGTIHLLMIGDPGTGKSTLLKKTLRILPKGMYSSGKGISGAGLTAGVIRDELLDGFTAKMGLLPLCNEGTALIDELDKISETDIDQFHNVMESGIVVLTKIVQVTFSARTGIISAANPKFGKYDRMMPLDKQFNLPITIINRFDSILVFEDVVNAEKDKLRADFILNTYQSNENKENLNFCKSYLRYCSELTPVLTSEVKSFISDIYIGIRTRLNPDAFLPINDRMLRTLTNYTYAIAKINIHEKTTLEDAMEAVKLVKFWLQKLDVYNEITNTYDNSPLITGQKGNLTKIEKGIFTIMEGKDVVYFELIYEKVCELLKPSLISQYDFDKVVEKMNMKGDLMMVKNGYYKLNK